MIVISILNLRETQSSVIKQICVLCVTGIEINYEMYNPVLQKIEVLRLEKRLDEELFYLRDAPPEFSTIPFNTEMISHPPGAPVPVNTTKVAHTSSTCYRVSPLFTVMFCI